MPGTENLLPFVPYEEFLNLPDDVHFSPISSPASSITLPVEEEDEDAGEDAGE